MSNSFNFNNDRREYISTLKKGLPVLAPREHQFINIPVRPGALHMGTTTDVRTLEIPIFIEKPEYMTFANVREDLATWLTTEQAAPLVFDDETDRTYFALLEDVSDFEILSFTNATCTITFVCPDPYRYSDEKQVLLPSSNPLNGFSPKTVDVLGNLETYPVVRLVAKRKLNFFSLVSPTDYFQVGSAATVEAPSYDPETLVFSDDMTTILNWSQATNVDNGYIAGEIASSGDYFYPNLFGQVVQPPMWQGPSLKKNIGKALTDFRADVNIQLFNTPETRTGMLEIYFLNAANETVAKIGLEDRFAGRNYMVAKAGLGGTLDRTWIYADGADKPQNWDNFTGILRIERKNKWWTAYFSTVDEKGVHTYPKGTGGFLTFHDSEGKYASQVTQVQVSFRMYPETEKADMRVHDIQIWEYNQPPQVEAPPVIAQVGDILEIDHYKNTVRRNGEIVQGLKDFRSNFFPLKPGRNRLHFQPPDAGDVTVTFRERYL